MRSFSLLVSVLGAVLALAPLGAHGQGPTDWAGRDLAEVRQAAAGGQKAAQLELGKRYEIGAGVEQSKRQARAWYRRAARTSTSRRFAYSGAVGSEQHGRAIEVGGPVVTPGLPEAAARLHALERPQ